MLETLDQWLLLVAHQFNWRVPYWLYLLPVLLTGALPWKRHPGLSPGMTARLARYADPRLWPLVVRGKATAATPATVVAGFIPWMALILITLALAGPRWLHEQQTVFREGADIAVVMDVSRSMRSRDIKPDRLSRVQQELHDFLQRLNGDRIALVAFAGRAFTIAPLTSDYAAVMRFSGQLTPDMITNQGSNLALGLTRAFESLHAAHGRGRAVVLFTDGEDYARNASIAAALRLRDAHIPLFILGAGTPEGGLVPAGGGYFVHDDHGRAVLSRLRESHLKMLARTAGGKYARIRWDDRDWDTLYDDGVRRMVERTRTASRTRGRWREEYAWALLPAMLLLGWWWKRNMRKWMT